MRIVEYISNMSPEQIHGINARQRRNLRFRPDEVFESPDGRRMHVKRGGDGIMRWAEFVPDNLNHWHLGHKGGRVYTPEKTAWLAQREGFQNRVEPEVVARELVMATR